MTTTTTKTTPENIHTTVLARTLEEGYGPGAWHGADLSAAIGDVDAALAFWRPQPERHNIAEIAVHHAYTARHVRGRLTGRTPEPFLLEGDDWFALPDTLTWPQIVETVDAEQRRLTEAVDQIGSGRVQSPLTPAERFDLVLGITCHAIYHAGQVQLIKKLKQGQGA